MSEDWRTQAVKDFCRKNNVTVIVEDEWKTREKKVTLAKDKYAVIRRIFYDTIPTLLPSVLLNGMLREIPAEEGET